MKIFIGVSDLGRFGELLKEGFEAHGHTVDLCDMRPNRHICYEEPKYSLSTLRIQLRVSSILFPSELGGKCQNVDQFLRFFSKYDLVIYFFADSIIPGFMDHALIKSLGVKLVHIFCGDDIRYAPLEKIKGNWQERLYLDRLELLCHDEYISAQDLCRSWYAKYNNLSRRLYMARIVEKYCDAVFAYPCFDGLLRKGYFLFPFISDPVIHDDFIKKRRQLGQYAFSSSPVKVVHYASNLISKSSFRVRSVFKSKEIQKLSDSGLIHVSFERKLSQSSLYADLYRHDVVIDQYASIGAMTMDALAAGCLPVTGPNYSPMCEETLAFSSAHWRNAESGLSDMLIQLAIDDSIKQYFSSMVAKSYHARLPVHVASKILGSITTNSFDISPKQFHLSNYLSSLPNWNPFLNEIAAI